MYLKHQTTIIFSNNWEQTKYHWFVCYPIFPYLILYQENTSKTHYQSTSKTHDQSTSKTHYRSTSYTYSGLTSPNAHKISLFLSTNIQTVTKCIRFHKYVFSSYFIIIYIFCIYFFVSVGIHPCDYISYL